MQRPSNPGFSLIEMLTTISIVIILGALLFPTLGQLRTSYERNQCASNLRQIGVAIQAYCVEHDSTLPGPLYTDQQGWTTTESNGHLPNYLYAYLGMPVPDGKARKVPVFFCAAWKRVSPTPELWSARVYRVVQNGALQSATKVGSPFGYPAQTQSDGTTKPANPPYRLPALTYKSPAEIPAITDINVGSPLLPAHKTFRNYLYLDWHVETANYATDNLY